MIRELDLLQAGCIHVIEHNDQTINFAAQELVRYLEAITDCGIALKSAEQYDQREKGLWIGLPCDFPHSPFLVDEQEEYDDALWIDVSGGQGIISGVNPRSVLFSVYRFLNELGCRWVRPGADGEYLPKADIGSFTVRVYEHASYRYRGICIEGAVSLEHVTDMIDWMTKIGFNSYFIQFREAYFFFERWYNHLNNPLKLPSGDFNVEVARAYVALAKQEIQKRGMIYQAVGHGWTCAPFGIVGLSWEKWGDEVDPETSQFFALVNGKRELWQGIPINTDLCYSNSEARSKMIEEIVLYASLHPEVDLLHVWLSDGFNNQCECEQCVLMSPSDLYVRLMNELDEGLTALGIETRIVFLIYHELLWPPEYEKFINPDRFVMQFAPITRSYRQSFSTIEGVSDVPPFFRNKVDLPQTVEGNVSFLKAWQSRFKGDSFDFDYHFMWAHQRDPGYVHISRMVYEDIRHLHQIGLNGFVSCQVQRAFFPNGLGMTVMARTLWNKELSFREMAEDYYASAYGEDGPLCLKYAEELSELYFDLNLEKETDRNEVDRKSCFQNIYSLIRQFECVIEKNIHHANPCHAVSWRHLGIHAEIWTEMTRGLELLDRGEVEQALCIWEGVKTMVWKNEENCHRVFDVYNFVGVFDEIFSVKAL
ncbi:DUF4838 domain-containing protein [Paenibacillus baekrokdamisoli]|uniref:DUF4838 domain-containing protein n=1 Tax=Paenibacillus baekrokdamisoli TaxID=1712516 RepID=A0A3G9JNK4_9BACL|nr:DUF4838 domain-containing protein [Paenibacillus baekrokdamisoli]MBB3071344.1 hypothetical protein [Paenibacillus baekrokdamisoli]BBH24619.1 DUF4838 domain-containing protein [Paenibacillus baekrokdamisoli]